MQIYEYLAKVVSAALNNDIYSEFPKDFSLDEIEDIAIRNHISYIVFSALLQDENIDADKKEYLRSCVKHDVFYTLIQLNELKSIKAKFDECGVKNMPMKGSVLKYIYPRPELREMSDLDILIENKDLSIVGDALDNLGYSLLRSIKHHDIYHKGGVVVEAHKSMYDKTVDNAQYKYFLGFDKAVLSEGYEYSYEFKNEDFYVYMLAHAAKHFYIMGCGVRNLIDVYVYLNKFGDSMDREYVDRELERCGILDFTKHMEKLAFDWLEGRELDDFYLSLFKYMLDSGIYGKDENGIWSKLAESQDEKVTNKSLKLWYFFPPLYYIAEYYPWVEDHKFLLPVAWFMRFFRGTFMHKGKKKREMLKTINEDKIMTYKRIYQKMNLDFHSRE